MVRLVARNTQHITRQPMRKQFHHYVKPFLCIRLQVDETVMYFFQNTITLKKVTSKSKRQKEERNRVRMPYDLNLDIVTVRDVFNFLWFG